MCGISGSIRNGRLLDSTISKTLDSLDHRGPDARAFKAFNLPSGNYCYLLHNRLSIIDLDKRSDQPITYNGLNLIFNGEIYNYIELRNELIKIGYTFSTDGDGEVFLKLIDCFGDSAYGKINGMWSAALFDAKTNTLTLSRDMFGEKPLYYYSSGRNFYFASEIRALENISDKRFDFNYQKIKEFLVLGYKFMFKNSEEFFNEVKRVDSGTLLKINEKLEVHTKRYFRVQQQESDDSFAESKIKVRDLITKSLELRMRSDVPIAFCLSGGIDSNTLVSTAKKILGKDITTFTIVSNDQRYDEEEYVRKVSKDLNIKNIQIGMQNGSFLSTYRDIVQKHKHILPTISYFMHSELQKSLSKHGFKVSLSGTGADEIFSGYHDHYPFHLADIKNSALFESEVSQWEEHLKPKIRNPLISDLDLFYKGSNREHIILHHEYFSSFLNDDFSYNFYEEEFQKESALRTRMHNEMFHEIVPPILHADDLNAMRFSVENRSPFLDKNLFNYVGTLPSSFLMRNGFTKYILRESMREIVPDYILDNRRKIGFNLNINELLPTSRSELVALFDKESELYEIVDKSKIIHFLKNDDFQKNSSSKFLFSLISILFLMDA